MDKTKKLAILTGDVNGIGAEITLKALNRLNLPIENVVLISNSKVLEFYGQQSPRSLREREIFQGEVRALEKWVRGKWEVVEIDFDPKDIKPGEITKESGEFSFQCLKRACELAKNGEIDAIVTAPVSKEALHLAGHKFNGQTEVLQEFLAHDNQHAEMLFVAGDFRVLLLTRHVALKDISLNKDEIIKKVVDLDVFFREKLGIFKPNFALCALNPHAGENGILGMEEIEILQPAVDELRRKGLEITNPMPADTLFINAAKNYLLQEGKKARWQEGKFFKFLRSNKINYSPIPLFTYSPKRQPSNHSTHQPSCYLACYHDQGLIPIKTVASDKTVNMTIGLDVIRTSPCHGTAYDIAGKNIASEDSMIEAILQALQSS